MELKKVTEEMRNALREPLPKEAVKPHPTKTYLSSIKAIYVTERINTVFGVGAWTLKANHEVTTEKGMVVIKAIFEIPEYGIYYESFGGNDNGGEGSKNFDLGDAYKGATTDAITKIGSYLEIGIDVFKGLNTPPPNNDKKTPDAGKPKPTELPWLNPNTDEWTKTVKALKDGYLMSAVEKRFRISKTNRETLLNDAASVA